MSGILIGVVDDDGHVRRYIRSFDPDGGDLSVPYPTGRAEYTDERAHARRFSSLGEALEYWRQPSARTPLRPDGKPNRPLTALTIEFVRDEP